MQVTTEAELEDYRWLVAGEGRALLRQIQADPADDLHLASTLRRRVSAARTHLLLQQRALRRRATSKFPQLAQHMFFTPRLLEQASGAGPAAWKAARFAGRGPIADLCCGLGGDLLALAACCDARAVDRDPLACLLAQANVQAARQADLLRGNVWFVQAQVRELHVCDAAAWHLDPDRRAASARSTRVDLASPGPDVIERLIAANPVGAIKLSPAAEVPLAWEERAELEWMSSSGECRQLVAWFGPLARVPGQRRATVLGAETATFAATELPMPGSNSLPLAERLGRVLCEPDPSVLAARLAGALAARYELAPLDRHGGYLTADTSPPCGLLRAYEVLECLPLDLRRVKAVLRARRMGRIEVKKRAVDHDPARLVRQLAVPGEEEGVLILLRLGGRPTAVVCRRQQR
jgi:hypothetical protein